MKSPFFSIIIPTYNRAHLISAAIESVVAQSFQNWELIIVDDGSTDNTHEVIAGFSATDNRVKYIYQKNAERSAARNNGIRNALGEYVGFLDSDDAFAKDNLEQWHQFLAAHNFPKTFACCNYVLIDGSQRVPFVLPNAEVNRFLFIFKNPITAPRMCIHRSLFQEFLFEENMTIGEDVALWLKMTQKHSLLSANHFGIEYYVHEGNTVNPKNPSALKMYEGFMRFFAKYPEIRKEIPDKDFNDYISKVQTNIAKYYYRNNKKFKAAFELTKAVWRCPFHEHTKYRLRLIFLTFISNNPNLYE
jgi:glycosyltransferase involved in cell wall biosynthesis